jgi:hypothetical protein
MVYVEPWLSKADIDTHTGADDGPPWRTRLELPLISSRQIAAPDE